MSGHSARSSNRMYMQNPGNFNGNEKDISWPPNGRTLLTEMAEQEFSQVLQNTGSA